MEQQDVHTAKLRCSSIRKHGDDAAGRSGRKERCAAVHSIRRSGRGLGGRRSDDMVHPGECAVTGRWNHEHHLLRRRRRLRHHRRRRARLDVRAGTVDQGMERRFIQFHQLPDDERIRILSGRRGCRTGRNEAGADMASFIPRRTEQQRRIDIRRRHQAVQLRQRDRRHHSGAEDDDLRRTVE